MNLNPPATLMKPVQALTTGFRLPDAGGSVAGALTPFFAGGRGPVPSALRQEDGGIYHRQGFKVGSLSLMIEYADGSELVDIQPAAHLPHTPDWFIGIVNLHGRLIPAFDLAHYLNTSTVPVQKQMMVVLSSGESAAGIVIEGLPQRLAWSDAQIIGNDPAPQKLQPMVRATCLIDGNIWFDLDCAALLDAFEQGLRAY